MSVKRTCDNCKKEIFADQQNLATRPIVCSPTGEEWGIKVSIIGKEGMDICIDCAKFLIDNSLKARLREVKSKHYGRWGHRQIEEKPAETKRGKINLTDARSVYLDHCKAPLRQLVLERLTDYDLNTISVYKASQDIAKRILEEFPTLKKIKTEEQMRQSVQSAISQMKDGEGNLPETTVREGKYNAYVENCGGYLTQLVQERIKDYDTKQRVFAIATKMGKALLKEFPKLGDEKTEKQVIFAVDTIIRVLKSENKIVVKSDKPKKVAKGKLPYELRLNMTLGEWITRKTGADFTITEEKIINLTDELYEEFGNTVSKKRLAKKVRAMLYFLKEKAGDSVKKVVEEAKPEVKTEEEQNPMSMFEVG